MKRIFLFFIILSIGISLLSCQKKNDQDQTTSGSRSTTSVSITSTTQTTQTTQRYSFEELIKSPLIKLSKDPIMDVPNNKYDVFMEKNDLKLIGNGDSFYLNVNDGFYQIIDLNVPVKAESNAFFHDIDNNGMDEIIIWDFHEQRSALVAFDTNTKQYVVYILEGILRTPVLFNEGSGFLLYSQDRQKFPYSLFMYTFVDEKLMKFDISNASGNIYSMLSDERYIFAGDKKNVKMYLFINNDLLENDASMYIESKSIFPRSSEELLTINELKAIIKYKVPFGIEEIYSRNGYVFENEIDNSFYDDKPWYIPNKDFRLDMLNSIEKANIRLINEYIEKTSKNVIVFDDMTADVDVNGDDNSDDITLKINNDKYQLKVNDAMIESTGDFLIEKLYIIDIDHNDEYLEVAISEAGPSSDYATYIYRYDGENIIYMGRVEGGADSLALYGDGEIVTYKRGLILQTWFYTYVFGVDGNQLVEKPKEEYMMNTFVILKKDLNVYESTTDKTLKYTIKANEPALIVSTDDKSYCRIKNKEQQEGIFFVDNFGDINKEGIFSGEYFEGLCFAD